MKPRNPVEESLVRIWSDLLNLKQVGVHDDLFQLAGDPLLAVKVILRIFKSHQVRSPLQVVCDCPKIADLANEVKKLCSDRME